MMTKNARDSYYHKKLRWQVVIREQRHFHKKTILLLSIPEPESKYKGIDSKSCGAMYYHYFVFSSIHDLIFLGYTTVAATW